MNRVPTPLLLHAFFETLGYVAAGLVYARLKRHDVLAQETRWTVIAGAAVGAAIGSRLLFWLCRPSLTLAHLADVHYLFGGKTIVGGLLGGWIGVELTKKMAGIRRSTGDLFVFPLLIATAIGRIGCFLAGPQDATYGDPTSLPWGIAIGDGVRRHPVALYEIAFLLALAPLLRFVQQRSRVEGDTFRVYLSAYLLFRLCIDFIKPEPPPLFAALSAIQWACVAGLLWYAGIFMQRLRNAGPATSSEPIRLQA
jgi:prolipoprotein diacylglyceryltransferase